VEQLNLIESLHRLAAVRALRPAIVAPKGTLSWAKLEALVWASAQQWHETGLRPGDRVGLTLSRPLVHLMTSLALTRIGVGQVSLPASESVSVRDSVSRRLGLKLVLTDPGAESLSVPTWAIEGLPDRDVTEQERLRIRSRELDAPWLIVQSSGTTGAPKFAEVSHRRAIERLQRSLHLFERRPDDLFWAASRLDFTVAKQRTYFNLLAGTPICLPLGLQGMADIVTFLKAQRVTLACGAPSHLYSLVDQGEALPSIRAFEARSAVISESLRRAFRSRVSSRLFVVYATNEGEALSIASPELQDCIPDTVGVPTGSVQLQIVDEEGAVLPPGQTGEIRARGSGFVDGYLDNAGASARAFKEGWFYPGDMGYLTPEGALILQGRTDDMMIFDGVNIFPAEIEQVLSAHPAVREVAAFGWAHPRYQDIPVAAVTLLDRIAEADLIRHCRERLGSKFPRRIFFLDELPKNPMGKVLKRELRAFARNELADSGSE
jgi:acyl-coenzyme A synthetase/AMP-(fatty) acid ligase